MPKCSGGRLLLTPIPTFSGSVVTKVQYTTRTRTISTITIRTTKVIATATRTVTDVFDYNRRGLTRRAAEVGNVAAADVLSPSADYVSSSDRQSLVQTEWISKHGLQKRHVCPVCPAGKTILPAVSNLGRTSADAALSYCCKLAKTVTRHKTRTTNVGKRTTLTVSTTRTITVTTDAKLGVWGYIHNGERPYEARSIVVTEQRPVIAKQQGRNHVVVANTTTNADGLFSVLIPRPPRGTNISIADAAHPQSPWITKQYTNQTEKFFNVIVPADQMPPPYTSTTTKTTTVTTTTCDCSIPTPWPYNPPRPVLMPP